MLDARASEQPSDSVAAKVLASMIWLRRSSVAKGDVPGSMCDISRLQSAE